MANGAFGQVRLAKDNVTDEDLAVKLENSNAKMPMLFLEYRFYKVVYIPLYDGTTTLFYQYRRLLKMITQVTIL